MRSDSFAEFAKLSKNDVNTNSERRTNRDMNW